MYCGWHPESSFDSDTLALTEQFVWFKIKYQDLWDLKMKDDNLGRVMKEMKSIGWQVFKVRIVDANQLAKLQMERAEWVRQRSVE